MIDRKPWVLTKCVIPQHTDHAGVLWHGTYINWLEESRINALKEAGLGYSDILDKNYELPVIKLNIEYIIPIFINEQIIINSYFELSRSPRIIIKSDFINVHKKITTKATINLALIEKNNFSIVKNRPEFIESTFKRLFEGPR